jgi:hypothetical protein
MRGRGLPAVEPTGPSANLERCAKCAGTIKYPASKIESEKARGLCELCVQWMPAWERWPNGAPT